MAARHHHYLSQCYLKGFTKGRAKKSKLTVIDLKQRKTFETIPRNVGGIRDFNRVEIEGVDPNAIESAMAGFEGKAATAINQLCESQCFSGEIKTIIFNLIALLAVRSPERREQIRQFESEIMERVMELSLDSKERWKEQEAKRKEKDPEYESNITYEELKEFFDNKEYRIELATERHIRNELIMIDAILPYLAGRNWLLLQSTQETGPFITTDSPVSLTWNEPQHVPAIYRDSPGYGMKNTLVYFPVSQDMALVGEFDKTDRTLMANKEMVALLNSKMLHNAHKQIYSPKISFFFSSKEGGVSHGNRILKEIHA